MRFATLFAVAGLMAAPLVAQDMPESYKQVQMRALEAERRMFLAMADTMPERLYRDKATPAQRDFAGQVLHHPNAFPFLLGRFVGATNPPALPDTAAMYNTRAGMKQAINTMYDWAGTVLRNQTTTQRAAMVDMFGARVPGWQVWDELHQHAYWTAGQIVANFRKHNMAPPGFGFF